MAEKKMASGQQDDVDTEYRQSSHQLEIIECDLSFIACKDQFPRQDQDEHMQRNAAKHMTLMATETLRKDQQFQEKDQQLQEKDHQIVRLQEVLQTQNDEMKRVLEVKDEQIRQLQELVRTGGGETKREKDQQMREKDETHAEEVTALKKKLQEIDDQFTPDDVPPYDLTVTDYRSLVRGLVVGRFLVGGSLAPKTWKSDDFYTHPGGYKFHIELHTPKRAVTFHPEQGEYDDTLPWPARVSITIELRNQNADHDHMPVTRRLEWGREDTGTKVISFSSSFIPRQNLRIPQSGTLYLLNNCLRFRITKIQVRK